MRIVPQAAGGIDRGLDGDRRRLIMLLLISGATKTVRELDALGDRRSLRAWRLAPLEAAAIRRPPMGR
jgi:hypothetical protein